MTLRPARPLAQRSENVRKASFSALAGSGHLPDYTHNLPLKSAVSVNVGGFEWGELRGGVIEFGILLAREHSRQINNRRFGLPATALCSIPHEGDAPHNSRVTRANGDVGPSVASSSIPVYPARKIRG